MIAEYREYRTGQCEPASDSCLGLGGLREILVSVGRRGGVVNDST